MAKNKELNPYLNGRRKWNDLLGGARAFARMSGLISLICSAITLCAVLALWQQSSQFRTEVVILEVDKLGRPMTSYSPTTKDAKNPNLIMADLAEFVRNWRAVYADGTALRANIEYVYERMKRSSSSFKAVNEFYRNNDPFSRAQDELVSITDVAALRTGDKSYQIEWIETRTDRAGKPLAEPNLYRTNITITQEETIKIEDSGLSLNPLGVYVEDITWSKIK